MWFGIPALVFTGLTWSFIGIIMSTAPKKGVSTSAYQFIASFFTIVLSTIVLLSTGALAKATPQANLLVLSCCCLSGFLNYFPLELMSRAMQKGPNGIIWSVVQSGLIFPFTMGIFFFGVTLNPYNQAGILMLVISLMIFGFAKNNENKGDKSWLYLTFTAFVICGLQQSVNNIPAYFEETREVTSVLKAMMNAAGICLAAICHSLVRTLLDACGTKNNKENAPSLLKLLNDAIHNRTTWIFVGIGQIFNIISGYILMYNGMDALAKAGIGNVSYPLLVGSCIIGFFVFSLIKLNEKLRFIHVLAVILCLGGIACICVKLKGEPEPMKLTIRQVFNCGSIQN